MKKWTLTLMVLAMVAVPALACGFPLPAGTEMMRISKAVCADGEAPETCQERQDAYQLMGKLQSAVVDDLNVHMLIDAPDEQIQADLLGSYDYQLITANVGLGANINAHWDEGQLTDASGTELLNDYEIIAIGEEFYVSQDGGQTWESEVVDQQTLMGLGMFLGLGGPLGAALDLYADPGIFTVTVGPDVEYEGQTMHVQTLTVDLEKLLASPEAALGLLEDGLTAGGDLMDMSMDDLGMTPQEFAMVLPLMQPMMDGTAFSTTIYIGADDGYIHYVEDNFTVAFDASAMDPTQAPIGLVYQMSGYITQHNQPLVITAPSNATEGSGGLFGDSDLFGSGVSTGDATPEATSSGLGDALFGAD
ncbi:hypothetical protein [Aggregatilinea lenta]|uniref:hypothetical protein n=1 Tax=Aggregatilinea lenta TaxID=913108 RepID=UPI000E5BD39F|nr:hypothetical protein [Aggregatilinea lenta]